MNKNRFLIVLCVLTFAFTNLDAQRGKKGPWHIIEENQETLKLTELQSAQLEELKEVYRAEMKEKMAERRQNRPDRRDEDGNRIQPTQEEMDQRKSDRKARAEKMKKDLEQILTPEQIKQLEEIRQGQKEDRKAFKNELKAYNREHVLPVMSAQRTKLEKDLTAEDQEVISELRAEMKDKKKEHKGLAKQGKHGRGGKGLLESNPELREKAMALVQKHKSRIQDLMSEIKNEREQWKADRKAIASKYGLGEDKAGLRSDGQPSSTEGVSKSQDSKPKGAFGRANKGRKGSMHRGKVKKALMFLMMDPNEAVAPKGLIPGAYGETMLYPNPGTTNQKMVLEIVNSGDVRIDLCNHSGHIIQNVFDGSLEPGRHELMLDNGNASAGAYQYRISGPDGLKLVPVIIQD